MAGGYYNGRATMSIPLTSLLQPDQADDRTVTNHHGKKSTFTRTTEGGRDFLANQLTLFQPGWKIMPTKLLL